jgi:hypothetical protein
VVEPAPAVAKHGGTGPSGPATPPAAGGLRRGVGTGPAARDGPTGTPLATAFLLDAARERFDTLDELRARIRQFVADFNEHWLLERHGYRTPAQARESLRHAAMA